MLTELILRNFKSFREASLALGPLTVISGVNASGKSNLVDALRFVHGLARGYTLPDAVGQVYGESGERVWSGIRGGLYHLIYKEDYTECASMRIDARFAYVDAQSCQHSANYGVSVLRRSSTDYSIGNQSIAMDGREPLLLSTDDDPTLDPVFRHMGRMALDSERDHDYEEPLIQAGSLLESMRFLDFDPEALKKPSFPGQKVLGDKGENLSSVLYEIWQDDAAKKRFAHWLNELTPTDVSNLDFYKDPAGLVTLKIEEQAGRTIYPYSASHGTLRFLALLAALLGPKPARIHVLEEIENGIHPARLNLLINLLESVTRQGQTQIIATTHSPLVLSLLSPDSLEHATVTYRLEGQPDTKARRILDIPHARELLKKQDLARLHASGWLEDALELSESEEIAV